MTITESISQYMAALTCHFITKYYKLPRHKVSLIKGWYHKFILRNKHILKRWWKDPNKFRTKANKVYITKLLGKSYKLLVAICCKLYGKDIVEHFEESWVFFMYTCAHKGYIFS